MFTGIVEEMGTVITARSNRLKISASVVLDDMKTSDSICVNGACLTIVSRDETSFSVDVVPETLRRTNLGFLRKGHSVNLERSLPADGRFGGHIVQGHVDCTGTVASIVVDGNGLLIEFKAPLSLMRYVVEKAFIAVDGTSLTVVNCDDLSFRSTIIPYTRDNTLLGSRKVGDLVNLEPDILAKYVERLGTMSNTLIQIDNQQ